MADEGGERPGAEQSSSRALVLHGLEADGPAAPDEPLGIFSTRRPRDLTAGTSSALKSVTKGILAGAAGLVAAPWVGAQNDGAMGFLTGLGVGLVGAVALPIAGAAVGAAQIARGVYNSGEAASEAGQGKVWCEARREWHFYSLKEEARRVLSEPEGAATEAGGGSGPRAAGGTGGAGGRGARVAETDLYDVLRVPPDAPAPAIKKAYYTLARRLHPDKNPGDPEANAAFQAVGEAYQVLSNPELRAKYDRSGKAALGGQPLLESATFFAILFGSEQFDALVGELQLAMLFGMDGGQASERALSARQARREVLCALHLAQLLSMHVAGDEAEFAQDAHELAQRLRRGSFGEVLLHTIGCVYEGKAAEHLGEGPFATRLAQLRAHGHAASSAIRLAQAGVRTYQVFRQVERSVEARKAGGDLDAQANLCALTLRRGARRARRALTRARTRHASPLPAAHSRWSARARWR